jgi:beta-phosphoglucomutase-like phosphatase (HAD superfamily)
MFDLDGTLVDTESLSDQALLLSLRSCLSEELWERLYNEQRHRLPWELKKQILGLRGSEWGPIILRHAREAWFADPSRIPTVQELWDAWEENLNQLCSSVEACRGACKIVERFAAIGLPLAIATSSRASAAQQKLRKHRPIMNRIHTLVAGDDPAVRRGKPAPDIYLEASRRLGVRPDRCLVFEDALSGCRAGKEAGCIVVAVPDERFTHEERVVFEEVADFVIPDLRHFDFEKLGLDAASGR